MSFDMGIYDTILMVIALGGAVLAYLFVKPRHTDDNHTHAADE